MNTEHIGKKKMFILLKLTEPYLLSYHLIILLVSIRDWPADIVASMVIPHPK